MDRIAEITFESMSWLSFSRNNGARFFILFSCLVTAVVPALTHLVSSYSQVDPEIADKRTYATFLLLVTVFSLRAIQLNHTENYSSNERTQNYFWFILFILLAFSASTVTALKGNENHWFWGYGKIIAFVGVLLTPILIWIFYSENKLIHSLLSFATYSFLIVIYLPSILQPPWGVYDYYHSSFVIEEILAPTNGAYPLVNFTSQYTSILGYAFNFIFRNHGTLGNAVWFLTILSIATLMLILFTLVHCYPAGKRYFGILITIPGIFIVSLNRHTGTLASLFSSIPVRLLFPAIIAALIVTNASPRLRRYREAAMAMVCGIAIFNNFESGIVATISIMATQLILSIKNRNFYPFLFLLLEFLLTVSLITASFYLKFQNFEFRSLVEYTVRYGGGFHTLPMPSFGLWIFVFVILFFCIITTIVHIQKNNDGSAGDCAHHTQSSLCLFWSFFGTGMLPYYINRSAVSGQLQLILFTVFLASAFLFINVSRKFVFSKAVSSLFFWICLLPGALSVASLKQSPSVPMSAYRLKMINTPPHYSHRYLKQRDEIINQVDYYKKKHPEIKTGVVHSFCNSLNIDSLGKCYLPFNSVENFVISRDKFAKIMFDNIEKDKVGLIILENRYIGIDTLLHNSGYVQADSTASIRVFIKAQLVDHE